MNYDPKTFLASLKPEQRKVYDRMTERINELERLLAQATPRDMEPKKG